MPKNCCFLSAVDVGPVPPDDNLAIPFLKERGWEVATIPWTDTQTDWNRFDLVVIRSTWDYHHRAAEFLETLRQIEAGHSILENSLQLIEWNLDKIYLRNLKSRGVKIVPTQFETGIISPDDFTRWQRQLGSNELVIKPSISATAMNTFRLSSFDREIESLYDGGTFLVQPFVDSIVSEGEFSLFYFDGIYSHAILKSPKSGDFRVQEDFGGTVKPIQPTPEMSAAGRIAIDALDAVPLYGRVDLVRSKAGFLLMELELIEPALYFASDPHAPENFANALAARSGD